LRQGEPHAGERPDRSPGRSASGAGSVANGRNGSMGVLDRDPGGELESRL
jgi:hypothetical protein